MRCNDDKIQWGHAEYDLPLKTKRVVKRINIEEP